MSTITVAATTAHNWTAGGSTATLRIFATDNFQTSGGTTILRGNPQKNEFYKSIDCTVSGSTVTIPSTTIDSTTDGIPQTRRYNAWLYDSNGVRRTLFAADLAVTHLTTPTTWTNIIMFSREFPGWDDTNVYTKSEIEARLADLDVVGGQLTLANTYSNDLATAIDSIGATPTVLVIDADTTITTALTVPATLQLHPIGGAKIIRSESGALTFEGKGLVDPESQTPVFSGFTIDHDILSNVNYQDPTSAKIRWTGTVFPDRLSANLWDNAEYYTRAMNAIEAISGKVATVVLYPGDYLHKIYLREDLSLHMTEGAYTSSLFAYASSGDNANIIMEDNTLVYGDGQGKTVWTESSLNVNFIKASGIEFPGNAFGNTQIHVRDITFQGNASAGYDSASAAVLLGNVVTGSVRHCDFLDTHGFAAFVGGFQSVTNDQANGAWITDNYIKGLGTQYIGTIGGMNVHISRNVIVASTPTGAVSAAIIDIEPNSNTWGSENLFIEDNIIDGRLSHTSWNGITVQRAYAGSVRNVKISGNLILNLDGSYHTFNGNTDVDTGTNTITCHNHGYQLGQLIQIVSPASYKYVIPVTQHTYQLADSYALAVAGTSIDLAAYSINNIFNTTSLGSMANGIQVFSIERAVVENNIILGGGQAAIAIGGAFLPTIKNNTLIAASNGLTMEGVAGGHIDGNRFQSVSGTQLGQSPSVVESEVVHNVSTTSGSPIIRDLSVATPLPHWWTGYTVTISGTDYTISEVMTSGSGTDLRLSANVPSTNASIAATFKFSSNFYSNNNFSVVTLMAGSRMYSDAKRTVSTSYTPSQITSSQNDYNPGSTAYRWNLSTDASRSITGIRLDNGSTPHTQLDGQRHFIYNAGSFDIVLEHEDGLSTEAYRLHSTTGADLTLTAGQGADIEYSTALSRWIVFQRGEVTLTGTQTLTNKTLTSPIMTTPTLGAATATSINLGGATVTDILTGTATLNFDLSASASQDLTISVTGASVGDAVQIGVPHDSVTADTLFWGWVSATDTVTIRAMRIAGTPNPASGDFRAVVIKF